MDTSPISQVYLVHHTHMDIGYTDLAREVRAQHLNHLDEVLEICSRQAELPRQFFWTCESALLVKDYLESRPQPQREALLHALRQGWIELQAFLTQPLTELPSAQELVDCLAYAVGLGQREGFDVTCAMIDDIGGYAGRLPTVMSQLGIRYLVAGVGAFQVHLPWADLPHLFYLESPDGHRVLVWNLGVDRTKTPQDMESLCAVYGQGALYLIQPYAKALSGRQQRGVEVDVEDDGLSIDARRRFCELEDRLVRESYPYNEILLQYGGDNQGPDAHLPELVSQLNQQPDLPDICLTTPTTFFQHMEEKYADRIPVLRGVITDPWILRANPQPETLAQHRKAQRLLETVQGRRALTGIPNDSRLNAMIQEAEMMLQFGSDHTCGLSEWYWQDAYSNDKRTRSAQFDRYRSSWKDKRTYADLALNLLQDIASRQRQLIGSASRPEGETVAVWNDQFVCHRGPAELYLGRGSAKLTGLKDPETGEAINFQQIAPARYVIDCPPVPAMGVRFLKPSQKDTSPTAETTQHRPLPSPALQITLDRKTGGIASIVDRKSGREFLTTPTVGTFGLARACSVSGVPPGPVQAGMSQELVFSPRNADFVSLEEDTNGALFSSFRTVHRLSGPSGPTMIQREIRVFRRSPRIDIAVRVDKPETHEKECLELLFPFAGKTGRFRFDQALGVVRPAEDLLPGAMQDLFYGHSWVRLDADGWGVTVVCPDAPVVQLGEHRAGQWRDTCPFTTTSNDMVFQLYHNLLNTDCPIWQDVLTTFRFTLLFDDQSRERRDGEICRNAASALPLTADFFGTAVVQGTAERPFLACEPEAIRVLSIRQVSETKVAVMLENTHSEAVQALIKMSCSPRMAAKTSIGGKQLQQCNIRDGEIVESKLRPFEICCIQAELT